MNNAIDKALVDISVKILNDNMSIRGRLKGNSMYPLIKNDEIIKVKPLKENDLTVGDIVVFKADTLITVHRFLKEHASNGTIITTKGDSNMFFDPPNQKIDIIGKVISVEKSTGTIINLETRTWYVTNYIIAIYSFLTGIIYQKIYYIQNIVFKKRNNCFTNFFFKLTRLLVLLILRLFINLILFIQNIGSKLNLMGSKLNLMLCKTLFVQHK